MTRNLAEDSPTSRFSGISFRVRQLERRPCQKCGAALPLQTYRKVSEASINSAVIAACPGTFFGHQLGNDHQTDFRYVHLFDQVTVPTSMAAVKLTFPVPWQSGANQEYDDGIDFDVGIAIAFSTEPDSLLPVEELFVVANIAYVAACPIPPIERFTGRENPSFFIEGVEAATVPLPDVPAANPPANTGNQPDASLFIENPEAAATGLPEAP